MRGARTLQSTVRIPASARTASNAAVKLEPRSRIMNLTRCVWSPRSIRRLRACWAVHASGWMLRDAEDADPPGGVLDHGQDIGLGAIEQVDREEVAGKDRLGLGERRNCDQVGPVCRGAGIDAAGREDLPHGGRCDLYAESGQLAVDPAIPPAGVLTGQPADQRPDVAAGRWPAGPAARGPGGLAAADDVAVPAHDRVRGNQQPQPLAPRFGYHAEQGREQCPVRPVQLRAARLPPPQDRSWWRRIKISAVFHNSSRRDSRNPAATRVIRRKVR